MSDQNNHFLAIPFVLPPFSNFDGCDSSNRHSPLFTLSISLTNNVVRQQKRYNGTVSDSSERKKQLSMSLEEELGRLENELSQLHKRTWSQVAQLQHFQCSDIEGQRSLRQSQQRLEEALCQIIQHHSQKLICQSIVQSKHHNFELGDPVFDPKIQQQQNRQIESMVYSTENWLGGCLRRQIPFAEELLHVRRGDTIWVRSCSASFVSSSSSASSSSAAKNKWRRCIVLAIKYDLLFPRFIKVRPIERNSVDEGTMPLSQQEQYTIPLHELSNMPLAQWIAVESGALRPDNQMTRVDSGHSLATLSQLKSEVPKSAPINKMCVGEENSSPVTEIEYSQMESVATTRISVVSNSDEDILSRLPMNEFISQDNSLPTNEFISHDNSLPTSEFISQDNSLPTSEFISQDNSCKSQILGENIQWYTLNESMGATTINTNGTGGYSYTQEDLKRCAESEIQKIDGGKTEESPYKRKRNADETIQAVIEANITTKDHPQFERLSFQTALTTFQQMRPASGMETIPFKKPNLITVGSGTFRIGSKGKVVAND